MFIDFLLAIPLCLVSYKIWTPGVGCCATNDRYNQASFAFVNLVHKSGQNPIFSVNTGRITNFKACVCEGVIKDEKREKHVLKVVQIDFFLFWFTKAVKNTNLEL
jgi:hypothetical protein